MNQIPPASPAADIDNRDAQTLPQPTSQPRDARSLAVALAGIRADSQRSPEKYLRDTVVPHGGE